MKKVYIKVCVNLQNMYKTLRCFLEKFTQLTKILHDRRSRRSRQISSLKSRDFLKWMMTLKLSPLFCKSLRKNGVDLNLSTWQLVTVCQLVTAWQLVTVCQLVTVRQLVTTCQSLTALQLVIACNWSQLATGHTWQLVTPLTT